MSFKTFCYQPFLYVNAVLIGVFGLRRKGVRFEEKGCSV